MKKASKRSASVKPSYGKIVIHAAEMAKEMQMKYAAIPQWSGEDIHKLRVLCKKLRALVHLGRGVTFSRDRKRWNKSLAEAARILANARDGSVLIEWVSTAAESAPENCLPGMDKIVKKLQVDYPKRLPAGARAKILKALSEIGEQWPDLWGKIVEPTDIGLRTMMAEATEHAHEAEHDESPGIWHDWRRRVKYAAYQMEWKEHAKGKKPSTRYRGWKRLGSALGKVNDMHNLRRWLLDGGLKSKADHFLHDWVEANLEHWMTAAREAAAKLKLR